MNPIIYVVVDRNEVLSSSIYFWSREQANQAVALANNISPGLGFKVKELRNQ